MDIASGIWKAPKSNIALNQGTQPRIPVKQLWKKVSVFALNVVQQNTLEWKMS